jgi:transcriptional regulator with XRE-family HTH domain
MTPVEQFGRNLFMARRRAWMSQQQLATRAGLHRTEIGLLEKGKREPRLTTLINLLDALGADPRELLKGLKAEIGATAPRD